MGKAKDIILRPIDARMANEFMRRVHYSGKVVNNSQVHIGVFWHGELEGALQFGPSLDKRKLMGLVEGTKWNEFIELNRLAFTDVLPRNSESRAIAVAMRLLRKHAPQLKWVVSFAIFRLPGGSMQHEWQLRVNATALRDIAIYESRGASSLTAIRKRVELEPLEGYQLRYIYFLDPSCRQQLTVPEIPYSRIWELGAGMYRGERYDEQRAGEAMPVNAPGDQPGDRGFESHPPA